jgi:hypothetical protein
MVTAVAEMINAKGKFFFGLLISPLLIKTDSNPPKANINRRTEVEKDLLFLFEKGFEQSFAGNTLKVLQAVINFFSFLELL